MSISKSIVKPEKINLVGRLADFRTALEEEIKEIKSKGQSSILLFAGMKIESTGGGLWYRFMVEYMPVLPADTPCKLLIGTEQYEVTVISTEENAIIVCAKTALPENIAKAKLENGSTILMERLIKCIEDNSMNNNPAGERMFLQSDGQVYKAKQIFKYLDPYYEENSNEEQKNAVKSAMENDITFIWGPPGTGKTKVIGNIIEELNRHDRSVLIVSHTNTAVDGAIEKVYKSYESESYKKSHPNSETVPSILRIGTPVRQIPKDALLGTVNSFAQIVP